MSTSLFALLCTALVEIAVYAVAYPQQVLDMSVRALGRLEALVARNEFISAGGKFVREIEPMPPEFTADDWAASQQLREALDAAHVFAQQRYKLNIDGRTFDVRGPLALALKNFSSLSVEPATGKL